MSDRGRSRTPKSLSPSPIRSTRRPRSASYSRSPSRSRSPRTSVIAKTNGGTASSRSSGFRVIVVSGLSKNVLKGHLEEIFGEYGKITGIDLPLFKVSGLNRGKAAIEFDRPSDAETAIKHMDGGQLDGSFLNVQISEHPLPAPKPQSPPAPAQRRRSPSRSRSRSPYRRRRSPSYSRSPSPRRRGSYRSPPRYRGGRDSYIPNSGGGRGGYGPRGGNNVRGGFSGRPSGGRDRSRSPLPVRRPNERGAPRRPSPEYNRGARSTSRRRSYSASSYSSRSRSPAPRKKYTPSPSRSRSMSIDSRSRSRSPRRSYSRSPSPKK